MDDRGFSGTHTPHPDSPISGSDHFDLCYSSFSCLDPQHSREAMFFQSIPSGFVGGIESYLDPKYIADPGAFASRLPFLPLPNSYAMYDWGFEPAFIRKRNERERLRVKCVNEGYARLRDHLPQEFAEKRLSKVETLRGAIQYIKKLQSILGMDVNLYEQHTDKIFKNSSDSEQDKISDESSCKFTNNDTEHSSTVSISSRDDRLSICSGESEDAVSSPKVKTEIISSDKNVCESGHSNLYDYRLKGKIFCKTAKALLDKAPSAINNSCTASCCWVGNQKDSLDLYEPYFPDFISENKRQHSEMLDNHDFTLNLLLNEGNHHLENQNSKSVEEQLSRKRPMYESTTYEMENHRWRNKMAKHSCLDRTENGCSYSRESDSEGFKSDYSPSSASVSSPT